MQTGVAGPDGRSYRIDTYISTLTAVTGGRSVKQVTIAVRDNGNQNGAALARYVSIFDQSTGCDRTEQNPC